MILVFEKDNGDLMMFPSVDQAIVQCELIDVENGEYEFCDHEGQKYAYAVVGQSGLFSSGKYRLIPEDAPDIQHALKLVDKARYLEGKQCNLINMDELKALILQNRGAS
jgi:hypothetical protein